MGVHQGHDSIRKIGGQVLTPRSPTPQTPPRDPHQLLLPDEIMRGHCPQLRPATACGWLPCIQPNDNAMLLMQSINSASLETSPATQASDGALCLGRAGFLRLLAKGRARVFSLSWSKLAQRAALLRSDPFVISRIPPVGGISDTPSGRYEFQVT